MQTRLSHRLAALAASAAVCGTLFSTVATSMAVARVDLRPHMELPSVTVVASRQDLDAPANYATAQAKASVICANS